MQRTFAELIVAMGGKTTANPQTDGSKAIEPGGKIIHEVGGTHHGNGSKTIRHESVVPDVGREESVRQRRRSIREQRRQEPTLTIMALAWRASDYLLEELKKETCESPRRAAKSHAHGSSCRDQMDADGGGLGLVARSLGRRGRSGRNRHERHADRTGERLGTDPDLLRNYKPGDLWPLTFTSNSDARRLRFAM